MENTNKEEASNNGALNGEAFSNKSSIKTQLGPIPSPEEISIVREAIFVFCVCVSQLMTQAGVAQGIVPLREMSKDFNVGNEEGEQSWFAASYSLTVGTFILVSGRLGDMYGYKFMYVCGYIWMAVFSAASGFCAFADTPIIFDVMRSLQGIGPAIIMPNSQALIGHYFSGPRKNLYMSLFGAIAPGGFTLGGLFSAIFAQLVWWPWAFWVGGMFSLFMSFLGFVVIPKRIGNHNVERGKFDFLGSSLGVGGLVLFNFAWNQGPNIGWNKPYVYILLIVGVLFFITFYFVEKRVKDPLVPQEVLKGDTGFVLGCIGAGWSCFGIWLYYMFKWSQVVDRSSTIMSAVEVIPTLVMGYVSAITTIFLLKALPSSVVMLIAMLSFFTGIVLMGTRPVGEIYWRQKFFSLIISPLGMDVSFPAAIIIMSEALPKRQQGIAGSLVSTFVNYSISIGLGLAGTVEYYRTKGKPSDTSTAIMGFRDAFYMGMGLAGFGVTLSSIFIFKQMFLRQRKKQGERKGEMDARDSSETNIDL